MEQKYKNKPLSPHLTIYKPQITSMMSIMHRITGFALYFACVAAVWAYACFQHCSFVNEQEFLAIFQSPLLKFILDGFGIVVTFCLYYHLLNGIRHLFWDIGKGYELQTVCKSGWLVIILSVIMTALSSLYVMQC